MKNDRRTAEQIKEHYLIEKQLAEKLRTASRQERQSLYTVVYEALFRAVPYLSQSTKASLNDDALRSVSFQLRNIGTLLENNSVFLEIGAGSCALSIEVSKLVASVHAIDITEKNILHSAVPENFRFELTDGCSVPIKTNSIDIAYSYQVMEHLHPDDALEQLCNIHRVLVPGGIYICDTPNRLSGPHDISRHFDRVATGFHLKEYSISELSKLFRVAGFSKLRTHIRIGQIHIFLPVFIAALAELLLDQLPYAVRRKVVNTWLVSLLLGVRLIGTKLAPA